jgi:non-homologous end joining protein Ku
MKDMVEKPELEEFQDDYRVELDKMIKAKQNGKKVKIPKKAVVEPTNDLLAQLQATVKASKAKVEA